jgi:hypothetical protein
LYVFASHRVRHAILFHYLILLYFFLTFSYGVPLVVFFSRPDNGKKRMREKGG